MSDFDQAPAKAPGITIREEYETPDGKWEDGSSSYPDRDFTDAKQPRVTKVPLGEVYE